MVKHRHNTTSGTLLYSLLVPRGLKLLQHFLQLQHETQGNWALLPVWAVPNSNLNLNAIELITNSSLNIRMQHVAQSAETARAFAMCL